MYVMRIFIVLYHSFDTVGMIESRRMKHAGHIAHMERLEMQTKLYPESPERF
jgi:hypothetical protein